MERQDRMNEEIFYKINDLCTGSMILKRISPCEGRALHEP